jgi:hypothetical protein
MLKLIVAFHNFANVLRISVCAFACVAFCNKAYFVSAQAQASLGFWSQWVQVKGMVLNVGGGVKLGCGPM